MGELRHTILTDKRRIKNSVSISRIVTMYYFDFMSNYQSSSEYHDFWEFVYVDNGHVIATADGNPYTISKGEIIFHKPNEVHSVKCDGITPANIFIITFVCKSPAMSFFKNKILSVPEAIQGLLASIVEEMRAAYGGTPGWIKETPVSPFGAEQVIKCYLETFLIMMIRSATGTDSNLTYTKNYYYEKTTQNKIVTEIIKILESRIYEDVTIEELCRITSYGKSQLCKLFKSVTGKTIMNYYTYLKINESKVLMRHQQLNNSQVSDTLGFSSPQYFSRVFKQNTGMTPGAYKKSVKYK